MKLEIPDRPFIILDTSIVVSWFFTDEINHVESLSVLHHLGLKSDRYFVPGLFYSELIHVLARKSGNDISFVKDAVKKVMSLGLRQLTLSESILESIVSWSCKGLSGYDATFVALAEDLGGIWLTADIPAAKKVGSALARPLEEWSGDQ
jgi:predicted nucleic acid-binding protein